MNLLEPFLCLLNEQFNELFLERIFGFNGHRLRLFSNTISMLRLTLPSHFQAGRPILRSHLTCAPFPQVVLWRSRRLVRLLPLAERVFRCDFVLRSEVLPSLELSLPRSPIREVAPLSLPLS